MQRSLNCYKHDAENHITINRINNNIYLKFLGCYTFSLRYIW